MFPTLIDIYGKITSRRLNAVFSSNGIADIFAHVESFLCPCLYLAKSGYALSQGSLCEIINYMN
jgi:hypothetical protein